MKPIARTVSAAGVAVVTFLSLGACQPSGAQQASAPKGPSEKDIASAYHADYKVPAGTRSECLGRVTFEVSEQSRFEWGLPRRVRTNEEILGFSRILRGDQDNIHLDGVAVVVAAEANLKTIQEMQRIAGVHKNIALQDIDETIRRRLSVIEDQLRQLNDPAQSKTLEERKAFEASIADFKKDLDEARRDRPLLERDWHTNDWGLPDSTGYIAGSTLYAFLLRDGFAFQFMSTGGDDEPPFEQRLAAFKKLLSRFESRALYQVPSKPGLCIPHGFIADDGTSHFSAEVSYRYVDAPGVIYSLTTGVEGERNFNPTEPMLVATGRSAVAGLLGNSYGRRIKTLGPKPVKIGARSGTLGGITTTEGISGYSVYAGTSGWAHSQVLPHIALSMRSFDRETVPDELKVDPPPLAQSLPRFELTLSSIRTRKN